MLTDKNNPSKLRQRILATLNYFDIFDYPLTLIEIYKYLLDIKGQGFKKEISLIVIKESLNQLCCEGRLESLSGFYFLSGRDQTVLIRLNRYKLSQNKYKKAVKIGRILSFIPCLRLIAVCNNLAYNNVQKGSDIDFFIITANRRIWFVRFFSNLILSILRLRPKILDLKMVQQLSYTTNQNNQSNQKIKNCCINQDKICTSFFITENNLNLELYKICDHDWYLMFWIMQIKPIYDQNNLYKKFVQANLWIKKFLPYTISQNLSYKQLDRQSAISCRLKNFLEKFIINLDEKFYRWMQLKLMPKNLKQLAKTDENQVIITDNILKFHQNDRRREYNQEFEKRLEKISNYSTN